MRTQIRLMLVMSTVALASNAATAQSVEQLSGLGGPNSRAYGINDNGQIVGQADSGTGFERAVTWERGTIRDLGSVFGASSSSVARSINAGGDIVGGSVDGSFNGTATLWSRGGVTDIGATMRGAGNSTAWSINDFGQIAGQAAFTGGFSTGFFYDPTLGGGEAGTPSGVNGGANLGINNNGVMVGHSFFFGDPNRATLALPGKTPGTYETRNIGPDGRALSVATAVNSGGMIVGHTNGGTGPWQAAVFTPDERDTYYTLGTLDGLNTSEALALNDSGMVVGYAWDGLSTGLDPRAWAWNGTRMFDLNDLLDPRSNFEVLLQATGVNNNGDIVGFGRLYSGDVASFVINGFVPAPGTAGVLMLGLGAAFRRRR